MANTEECFQLTLILVVHGSSAKQKKIINLNPYALITPRSLPDGWLVALRMPPAWLLGSFLKQNKASRFSRSRCPSEERGLIYYPQDTGAKGQLLSSDWALLVASDLRRGALCLLDNDCHVSDFRVRLPPLKSCIFYPRMLHLKNNDMKTRYC